MKEFALAYAEAGWPVLWVYGMRQENGEWGCTCGLPSSSKVCNPTSRSQGKHPPFNGHGAHDATTDPEIIASWPWHDGPNIGIAGRDSNPIIDIDDPEITAKLLDPEFGLRDIATASTTGRGLHIYMQCAPTGTGNIYKNTNERIGEIRAHGTYVVAPPSMHWSGRAYSWVGDSILTQGPTVTDKDAWHYLADLLLPLGVTILPKRESGVNPPREEIIDTLTELPYHTTNATLIATINTPQMYASSQDRSGDLFKLACDLVRDTRSLNIAVNAYSLAGVVKSTDIRRGNYHPQGPKYAFRNNGDEMYWDIIHKAYRAVDKDEQDAADKAAKKAADMPIGGDAEMFEAAASQTFFYQSEPPAFLDATSPKRPAKISNFEPKILETVTSWSGEETDVPVDRLWMVQLRLGDEIHQMKIQAKDYRETRTLIAAIQNDIPSHFVITDGMGGKLAQGIREYSGVPPVRRALALSGWVPNRDAFLFPGGPGAITPTGIDTDTRFEDWEAPSRFLQYGWSVLPKEGVDLPTVARALFNLREPHIMIPLLNQIFGASLASLGVGKEPTVAHMFARTGSFKSSVVRIALSVFGRFTNAQTDQVDEWKGTPTSLQTTMFRSRDLPLLLDDFKLIRFNQKEMDERIGLIQNYADRTGRTRSSRTQREQEHQIPRCLLLSTGEDIWDGQESAVARTLVIDASLADDLGRVNDLKARMTTLQSMAANGWLGALGYEWIHWLVTRGRAQLEGDIASSYVQTRDKMMTSDLAGQHPRVASAVSMLLSVSAIFMQFLQERVPEVYEDYRSLARDGWGRTINTAAVKAQDARALSPYHQFVNALVSGISAGEAYLQQRVKSAEPIGMAGTDVIGFVDNEAVWLNENISLGWYRVRQRRQGLDSHIGWEPFLQEAKRDHNATHPQHATSIYGAPSQRMVRIPLEDFFGAEVYRTMVEARSQ